MTAADIVQATPNEENHIKITAEIVSAYLSNNSLSAMEVPDFIHNISSTLQQITDKGGRPNTVSVTNQKPAVPIKKSVFADRIICLEDGLSFKSLKRHLRAYYNMSPEEYRIKWGLPPDYPMTASEYSKRRASIAKDTGLGYSRKKK